MKKEYTQPTFEIIIMEDVIVTSGFGTEIPGGYEDGTFTDGGQDKPSW